MVVFFDNFLFHKSRFGCHILIEATYKFYSLLNWALRNKYLVRFIEWDCKFHVFSA
jgi:hypothetical protein